MAKAKEKSQKSLKQGFTITVSADEIEKAIVRRLEDIGKKARIQGFRPGKAPLNVLRQRFGGSARDDVLDRTVSDRVAKELTDRDLRPAQQPKVEVVSSGEGKDLELKVEVEALPEIMPMDFGALSFERPTADVADSAVDDTILRLAKSLREPEAVSEPRKAKKGDVLIIDFDGTVDGTAYPGMKGDDYSLELGSHSFVGTFEDQLVGAKPGDNKSIKVEFPNDYHAEHLAGKRADFEVTVKELRTYKPIEMNDELAKQIGFPAMGALRERIADDLRANYARLSRAVLKRHLMDKLAEGHDFPVPEGLLEAEFTSIWQQLMKEKEHGHLSGEDAKKTDDELRGEYRQIAERRIRLGLLLADVAQHNKIEVSSTDLRNAMIAEARRYPGQEKAVIDYYMKTQGALERFRAPILEEKVVDFILAQTKITDKKMSVEALTNLSNEEG
jgi:trigger factor